MYYFGHVFKEKSELNKHQTQCIFNQGPVIYNDDTRIILGKTSKEDIMNEHFPNRQKVQNQQFIEKNSQPVIYVPAVQNLKVQEAPIEPQTFSPFSFPKPSGEIEPQHSVQEKKRAFRYYELNDKPTNRKFNLLYSFGIELSINSLTIIEHKNVQSYSNFFNPDCFNKDVFTRYASMYTLFDPNAELSSFTYFRNTLGKMIGIDNTKAASHNEVFIVATPDSDVVGKFVWTEVAFLIVPASLIYDHATIPVQGSFYKKQDIQHHDRDKSTVKVEVKKAKTYKEKLLEDIHDGKINNVPVWIGELQNATLSIDELQDVSQTLDFIQEELEKKKKEHRFQRNKEMDAIKKEIVENRKFNNELRQLLNSKEKKIQQTEENLQDRKEKARLKFDRLLKAKLDERESTYLCAKEEIDHEVSENESLLARIEINIGNINNKLEELESVRVENHRQESDLENKAKKLEEELKQLSIKERTALKDTGLGLGAPKLSDFSCSSCKVNNKDVVFLPCRHMWRCKGCSLNVREGITRCESCGLIISKMIKVNKVEYKIPFDEILAKR